MGVEGATAAAVEALVGEAFMGEALGEALVDEAIRSAFAVMATVEGATGRGGVVIAAVADRLPGMGTI